MNFLTPLAFILTGLLPIIIALYVLKLRRREHQVSSTYLWRELVRDTTANAPWQRLHPNLLLILQILFLMALILALARPFSWTTSVTGDHLILIIDTSASMAATDLTPTRLQAARDQAWRLVTDAPTDVPVTLIAAGDEVHVALSASDDRGRIQRALDDITLSHGGSDMESALAMAAALASAAATRDAEAEIVVLSDGGVRLPEHSHGPATIRYTPIGATGDNQAISALSLESEAAGQSLSAFVRITNYTPQPIERRLTLHAYADSAEPNTAGQLVTVRDLTLPPEDAAVFVIPDLPPDTEAIKATLEGADPLPLDDQAWAVVPPASGGYKPSGAAGRTKVIIVGPGNRFLETALALLPAVEVTTVAPEDYINLAEAALDSAPSNQSIPPNNSALTIFDGELPAVDIYPPGAFFFVGPLRSTPFFSVTGSLTSEPAGSAMPPRPAAVDDPLLRFIEVQDIAIQTAARIPLPAWGRPVIVARTSQSEQSRSPLLIVGKTDTHRLAVLAFDLRDSDLPLRVAFPLLLANLVDYLLPGANSPLPDHIPLGHPLSIPLPPQAQAAVITDPYGQQIKLTPENGKARFADTKVPGVYRVAWQDTGRNTLTPIGPFAVNGYIALESDIAPRAQLGITGINQETSASREYIARREWWQALAWTAFVLLIIEWLVQYRGALAFIAAKLTGRQPATPDV